MASSRFGKKEIVNSTSEDESQSTKPKFTYRQSVAIVVTLFVITFFGLAYFYTHLPGFEESEKEHLKLPFNTEELKELARVLEKYSKTHPQYLLCGIVVTYIFLQTFAIPGSISLSILSGFFFNFPMALTLVCACSAIGATLCYIISSNIGRPIAIRWFPQRIAFCSQLVNENESNLLYFIIFLRITPLLPNWFINLSSPLVGVPYKPFFWGTFIGVAPPSVVAIQAGQTLYDLSSTGLLWTWKTMGGITLCAILSVLPIFLRKVLHVKTD